MPSPLITALAAQIHEVAAQVGPGWPDEGDPAAALADVRELLVDVSEAARRSWGTAADGWAGAGADAAVAFLSGATLTADQLAQRIDELQTRTAGASDAVAWAHTRLREIVDRFEDRAAALEAHLDEPGVAEQLRADAQQALDDAVAVVDALRIELDGHTAAISAPPPPPMAAGAPTAPAGFSPPAGFPASGGFPSAPMGSMPSWGSPPVGTFDTGTTPDAVLAGLPLPDPAEFGDGVAVTLPDGTTVMAPNPVAASAVRHALTQLGVPYQWGGTSPGVGLDCSGLTQWAYHEAGLDLPRLAQEQDTGGAVNQNSLRPGDLAVWDGHVAMIVGDGLMIEAGDPVQLSPIRTSNAGQGFQGFWRPTA